MAQSAQANPAATSSAGGMRSEIAGKWPKMSANEIADLKSKDDLVKQVQSKYELDEAQAQKDVDAFAKGRQL
jgi:hypothetical protein